MKTAIMIIAYLLVFNDDALGNDKHLFIMSGQSNMAYLDPYEVFVPMIEKYYGKNNIIVVHDAEPGKSISNWLENAWLWERLKSDVQNATAGKKIIAVTFIWMQGESDNKFADLYEERLRDLFDRVDSLFPLAKNYFVIGRITDWPLAYSPEGWEKIREIQERICSEHRNFKMVNTDDLNGENNDIHFWGYYDVLGKRFAESAINLARKRFPYGLVVNAIAAKKNIER